jgi:hypothetical protein
MFSMRNEGKSIGLKFLKSSSLCWLTESADWRQMEIREFIIYFAADTALI